MLTSTGHRRRVARFAAIVLFALAAPADEVVTFRGRVTLEDGSPPGHMVSVQRTCQGEELSRPEGAASGKTGEYFVRLRMSEFGDVSGGLSGYALLPCVLEASDKGFISTQIDLSDRSMLRNPRLPDIVLTPVTSGSLLISANSAVPRAASRNWGEAIKQITARNWAAAESPLRAVVDAAPKFAAGWAALGSVYSNVGKPQDAAQALNRAIELDPKPIPPYLSLVHAQIDLQDWKSAAATSQSLIARDSKHVYTEAYFLSACALYQLNDYDNALDRINEAIRLDKLHELQRAEFVLGLILEGKKDYAGAELHMKAYIRQYPRATDIDRVHERLKNLGSSALEELATALTPLELRVAPVGEAAVPGGMKAFAAIAQMKGPFSTEDFFLKYSRAITDGGPNAVNPTKEAADEIKVFVSTVSALEPLGEHHENGTLIRVGWSGDTEIRKSRAILAEMGWKLLANGESLAFGDRPKDGTRQWVLTALGVDELTLRDAVRSRREFTFEIPEERARLVGGPAWGLVQKDLPEMALGPSESFIKDWRFARVYSGLGAMDSGAAAAVVQAIGLGNLIVKYSTLMADFGDSISLADQHVAVPGGLKAEPIWAKLAGANPRTPTPFLRALFDKDQGRLLAFYSDLIRADAAHQQYFTLTVERAEAFYKWYRDSVVLSSAVRPPDRWQSKLLQTLRLDASGKVIFPGGRSAWATGSQNDDQILLSGPLQALIAIAGLEDTRGASLSTQAARLLVDRYSQWHALFPYFEKLPNLDADEFRALAEFSDEAAKASAAHRNLLLGEWHSLVELIALGVQSGALSTARTAEVFREVCNAMRSENPSVRAIEIVRAMVGNSADLDEAIATHLLRLTGSRRDAFEAVKKLQSVPRLSALGTPPEAGRTLAALSGAVYAATLDPAYLLVAEDPRLLSKHIYAPAGSLFAPSSLAVSSDPPGTSFLGGFAAFRDAARALQGRVAGDVLPEAAEPAAAPTRSESASAGVPALPPPANDLVFRAGGRIVEVYATVTDSRGRYVDSLTANQFSVLEEGQQKPVFAFENRNAAVSVALLFDTTGSMIEALPPLKSAAMQLVDDLRPNDSLAVYSFADTVNELQSFTTDKDAVKRAILTTHAHGITALYDALVRVNRDLAARPGKKVIIVFTDGGDNASMLTAATAIERSKARGTPIYTIAQGAALQHPYLLAELANMSRSTGGATFQIRQLSDIGAVFDKVCQDLLHGYLVAFQPTPGENHSWRKIEVVLSGTKGLQVRAREGFFVE